jgi:glycerol-3-phosphate dehydrogenase
MLGHDRFTVTPRRGELLVFDKLSRPLVDHVLLAVPTATTKGVLVSPTVYGNLMVGPTAEDVESKDDTSSTAEGIAYLRAEAARIVPELEGHDVTAVYVGLRAATEHPDYQLTVHAPEGYACVGGIRSTGMSGAMAIAEHVATSSAPRTCRSSPSRTRPRPACRTSARPSRGRTRRPSASRRTPTTGGSCASASA